MTFDEKYFEHRTIEPKHLIDTGQWLIDLNISGKVLDAGCGLGHRCYAGKELYNKNFFGLDLDYPIMNNPYGYKEDIMVKASILNIPFSENEFELVICYDVLEHLNNVPEVEKALLELKRVANKYILISVPVIGNPNLSLDKTHHIKKTKEWWMHRIRQIGNVIETPSNWLFAGQIILCEVQK